VFVYRLDGDTLRLSFADPTKSPPPVLDDKNSPLMVLKTKRK
jgi:hypothetical protein